ncbi:hypothetical protein N3K66_006451 [Trichothecium roseum]|uniref:Uncharacterized protein n=1 Tax=Trichothecium roseum TaxID=47278 RepID=A0ACC0UVF0_9HYPO|nr:hypothetical protein N3K66_006451 [Trichothecium roseum]
MALPIPMEDQSYDSFSYDLPKNPIRLRHYMRHRSVKPRSVKPSTVERPQHVSMPPSPSFSSASVSSSPSALSPSLSVATPLTTPAVSVASNAIEKKLAVPLPSLSESNTITALFENQAAQITVDIVRGDAGISLVCFYSKSTEGKLMTADTESPVLSIDATLQQRLADTIRTLGAVMPDYMVPNVWMPLSWMPIITSTKVDRKKLQAIATGLPSLKPFTFRVEKREELTDLQAKVRSLWAATMGKNEESIALEDDFYKIGGDDIQMMTIAMSIKLELKCKLDTTITNAKSVSVADMARFVEQKTGA